MSEALGEQVSIGEQTKHRAEMHMKSKQEERGSSIVEFVLGTLLVGLFSIVALGQLSSTISDSYLRAGVQLAEAGGTSTTNPAGCDISCAPPTRTPAPGPAGFGIEE